MICILLQAAAGSDKEPKAAKKSKTKPKPKTTPAASKASGSKGASSGTERVRKVYDMPGQTRETPPEVRNSAVWASVPQACCIWDPA